MKKYVVVLAALAVLAAGCGDRGPDPSAISSSSSSFSSPSTTAPGRTAVGPGDWGTLRGVCGPKEGGGKVPASDAQGVHADSIDLGTVADPGFAGRAGLNQELFDAGDAFVTWCNAAGGVNGKKLVLTKRDAKLTDYQPVIEQACGHDFALVGGGAVQDNLWPTVGAACGLIDVAGFAVTAEKAGVAGDKPSKTRTVQSVPNPSDRYPVGPALMVDAKYPGAGDRMGVLYSDFQTLVNQKKKEEQAWAAINHTVVHEAAYNLGGESNWKPLATAIQRDRVTFLKFIGEPGFAGSLEQALKAIGYVPTVRLYEANFYDQVFIDSAGPAAEGAFVGLAYVPLEEADTNPATKLYVDNLDKSKGKQAVLGLQSTSAWLLFATLARDCDRDDNLTRTCILQHADEVEDWTGGGLHAATQPGENTGSQCWMVMVVKNGAFTRWNPAKGFTCDPKYQVTVKPAA